MKQNFCSDAETHGLPVTNQRDSKGASPLDVDRIVKASYPPLPSVGYRQVGSPNVRLLALIAIVSIVAIAVVVAIAKG